MKKSELKRIINEILIESVDLFNINDIKDLNKRQSGNILLYSFPRGNHTFVLPFNLSSGEFKFGVWDQARNIIDTNVELKDGSGHYTTAIVFSILKDIVNKHNIKNIEFSANGKSRKGLYKLYINKHFPDFELIEFAGDDYELRKK